MAVERIFYLISGNKKIVRPRREGFFYKLSRLFRYLPASGGSSLVSNIGIAS